MMLRSLSSIRCDVTTDTRAIGGLVSNRMRKASMRTSAGRVFCRKTFRVMSRT